MKENSFIEREQGLGLEIADNHATRINNLHSEIRRQATALMKKIIQMGELLVEQKNKVEHGQWKKWVEANLTFSLRTAQFYMQCFKRRDELKAQRVAPLREVMKFLGDGKGSGLKDRNAGKIGWPSVIKQMNNTSKIIYKNIGVGIPFDVETQALLKQAKNKLDEAYELFETQFDGRSKP